MIKQIAMVVTLGLILTIGTLTTIYPQHASAIRCCSNGVNPGGPLTVTVPHGHPSTGGATGAHQG